MTVQYIALALALLLAVVAVVAFVGATKPRQLDALRSATSQEPQDEHLPEGPKSAMTKRSAAERRHRELLASTHAETPRARSRASISDGLQPDSTRDCSRYRS